MDKLEAVAHGVAGELSLTVEDLVKNRHGAVILHVRDGEGEFALKVGGNNTVDPHMPSPAESIRQEALVARTLPPGPWPDVESSGECPGGAYILTPWLNGLSVTYYLVAYPPGARERKFKALVQGSFIALHALHRARTVHGDIQPEHLRVCDVGDPIQLIDFGCAARLGDRDAPRYRAGLVHFTPPEIARDILKHGQGTRSIEGDIYSLAASLAFAFDQHLLPLYPNGGEGLGWEEMMKVIAEGRIGAFAGPDDAVTRFLSACLSPDPAQRPGTEAALTLE